MSLFQIYHSGVLDLNVSYSKMREISLGKILTWYDGILRKANRDYLRVIFLTLKKFRGKKPMKHIKDGDRLEPAKDSLN